MDESSFRNPKLRDARLVAYKAFADAAGKGSVFLVTVVAARRLSPEAFGIFSLASTLGWILAVAADCGIQLHVARAVARTPARASGILSAWLRVRLWTTAAAIAVVMLGLIATQATLAFALPLLLFAIVYGGSGLIEFLHYFYRGLSRSDVESTLSYTPEEADSDSAPSLEEMGIKGPALVVRSGGGRAGETYHPEGERTTIGRSPDCEIFLDDVTVSRNHAVLVERDGKFFVEDEGSLNGTFVNRRRIDNAPLENGDELQIGKYRLTFVER